MRIKVRTSVKKICLGRINKEFGRVKESRHQLMILQKEKQSDIPGKRKFKCIFKRSRLIESIAKTMKILETMTKIF